MADSMERLLAIGFKPAGKWSTLNDVLKLTLEPRVLPQQNVLYAFVVNGSLAYVGKTTQGLQKRLQGYRSPASSAERGGSTNIKNNRNILRALASGATVDIYALDALPSSQHGEFSVNLSAGLEDSLIRALAPPWNGKGAAIKPPTITNSLASASLATPFNSRQTGPGALLNTSALPSLTPYAGAPSVEELFKFCGNVQGQQFRTLVRGTKFRVEVMNSFLEITPVSSGTARRDDKANISLLLTRLDKTGSFKMSDYKDVSFQASYVLALVKAWQSQGKA